MKILPRILAAFLLLSSGTASAQNQALGDLDNDGVATVRDIALIAGHFSGTTSLSEIQKQYADVNKDGAINDADMDELVNEILGTRTPEALPLAAIRSTSPASGEGDVAVTRETILHFTIPLSPSAELNTTQFKAEFGGKKILSRVELSSDRKKATLFYLEPLPSNARIQLALDGSGLTDLLGRPFDADGDGAGGGSWSGFFDTVTITPVSNTGISGRIFKSERSPGGLEVPIPGVTITVDGAEQTLRTTTDSMGNFTLNPCPAGEFFVSIDGRTSPLSAFPQGEYYPLLGKKWSAVAGRTDNLAVEGGTIYLPCICAGTLQPVSQTHDTTITFPPSVIAANPALQGIQITVPANSLFANSGARGGMVGLAPVASDRLPEPLPSGLKHTIDISIQSDGPSNFDRPVPISFPNLPDPETGEKLSPGAKSALWSFNHDLGEWEIVGPMTVTEDGLFVKTDAGVGVRQPGWHGQQPGGENEVDSPIDPPCESSRNAYARTVGSSVKLSHDLVLASNSLLDFGLGFFERTNPIVKFLAGWNVSYNAIQCYKEKSFNPCAQAVWGVVGIAADIATLNPAWAPATIAISRLAAVAGSYLDYESLIETRDSVITNANDYKSAYNSCKAAGHVSPSVADKAERDADNIINFLPAPPIIEDVGKFRDALLDLQRSIDLIRANKDMAYEFIANFTPEDPTGGLTPPEIEEIMADLEVMSIAQSELAGLQDLPDRINAVVRQWDSVLTSLRPPPPPPPIPPNPQPGGSSGGSISFGDSREPLPLPLYYMLVNGLFEDRFSMRKGQGLKKILAPNADYQIWVYDPTRNMICSAKFFSASNGSSRVIPPVVLVKDEGLDSDADGLSTDAERILGTDPAKRDTDNDGTSDGAEIQRGTNPLSGLIVATGVIASAPTAGYAQDVSALNNIAATANGAAGITLFNVLRGLNPVRLQEVDTPGTAVAVACEGERIAVADYNAGLAIVDISNPPGAFIFKQVDFGSPANCVTTYGPLACVGTANGTVTGVDLRTGAILWRVMSNAGEVKDLAVADQTLYAYRAGRVDAISLTSAVPVVGGSVTLTSPGSGRQRLSVGPGVLYVASFSGWDVLDIATNPLNPVVVVHRTTGQFSFKQLVSTGSSLAVAAAGGSPAVIDIDLYDAGVNGRGNSFLATLATPGLAEAVSIYNGLAYVADGDRGMQVVNYRAYDNLGVPPTITLGSNFNLAGGTAEEGALMRLTAQVGDDVQVRNVEFYMDGELLVTDGNFPFEHRFVTPAIAADKTSFKVRAKATDTGGNTTWSDEITLTLVPDATPPQVTAFFPPNNALTGAISELSVTFSEPMNVSTLSGGGLTLTSAGTDGILGNADDETISGMGVTFAPEVRTAYLALVSPPSPGLYQMRVASPAADAAGNIMSVPALATFRVFSFTDTDHDGIPDDWEVVLGLNPNTADSNNNGVLDGNEDFDDDGLSNAGEFLMGTDPRLDDTNGNGVNDGLEDTDLDGLADGQEIIRGTDPRDVDTDGDGWDDAGEIAEGTDPLESNSTPPLKLSSFAASFLNALPLVPHLGSFPVISTPASYLNSLPFGPDIGSYPVISSPASYLNSLPFGPDVGVFPLFSLPASYRNEPTVGLSLFPNQ